MASEHEHEEYDDGDHVIDFSESMQSISLHDDGDTASQRSVPIHDGHIVDSPATALHDEPPQSPDDVQHIQTQPPSSASSNSPSLEYQARSPNFTTTTSPRARTSAASRDVEPSIISSRASVAPSLASTLLSEPESISSATSSVSIAKKMRPESIVINTSGSKLILGLAVVDFNHIVGPTVEMAYPPSILEDEELCKILPFLALPDGAHLNQEDYCYFHVVPTKQNIFFGSQPSTSTAPPPIQTVFAISCNRQIATSALLAKEADVTRSTVQKAVVVLASKPLFGLIRDKLGVVTKAFFNQRDFRDISILKEFCDGLEGSIRAQLTESGVHMGTSLRELVHTFRHRTLMLLKLLMLQKRIVFYGHPVEKLCTYQYSLISLIPGLLLALEDCGDPELANRAPTLKRPTEFKSSDRQSLLKFMGLPLDLFGKDAFFQPYMPLQQIDHMSKPTYLCGTTNSIMTHQRNSIDLIVNIETNTFDFMDPAVERLVALTPADRKWMDDVVQDVTESWNENDPGRPITMQFKASDDYLRVKFEDYICSVLSTVKYTDFQMKGSRNSMTTAGTTGDANVMQNFGEAWLATFRQTNAFELWDRTTDPVIFDIVEPRHPCDSRPNPISDLGLRLTEGIHDLKLDKNIESTREAISSVIASGSTTLFKAFEGVRSEVSNRIAAQRAAAAAASAASGTSPGGSPNPTTPPALPNSTSNLSSTLSSSSSSTSTTPAFERRGSGFSLAPPQPVSGGGLKPLSLGVGLRRTSTTPAPASAVPVPAPPMSPTKLNDTAQAARATLGAWGTGIGNFLSSRASKISAASTTAATATTSTPSTPTQPPAPVSSSSASVNSTPAVTVSPTGSRTSSLAPSIASSLSARLGFAASSTAFPITIASAHESGDHSTSSPLESPTFVIRDLDKEREDAEAAARVQESHAL